MCQPPGPQQDWEQGWLWRGLGETDVVVPGQRVKSPNLKFWGDKDVFQGPTFLSQPERGDRRHSHSLPEFTASPWLHLLARRAVTEASAREREPMPRWLWGWDEALWQAWAEGLASLI